MSIPTVAPLVGDLDRVVADVTGEERQDYLDAVLSQRLRDVPVPSATSALELGPHGEPKGMLDLAVLDDRVVLLVPSSQAAVVDGLAARTFLADARFTVRDDVAALRVRGTTDDLRRVLGDLGVPAEHGAVLVDGDLLWLRWHHGADVVGPPDAVDAARARIEAAGARRADPAELDAAEVVAGVPRAPEEVAPGRLPEELGLLPTHVHLDKGCYPGQEAVARMWMLGRPRRRLALVSLPDGTTAGHVEDAPGSVEVTRVATVDGHTVGLALVGRDAAVGDAPHEEVEVLAIVGEGRPVPGHDPAVTRRRDRR